MEQACPGHECAGKPGWLWLQTLSSGGDLLPLVPHACGLYSSAVPSHFANICLSENSLHTLPQTVTLFFFFFLISTHHSNSPKRREIIKGEFLFPLIGPRDIEAEKILQVNSGNVKTSHFHFQLSDYDTAIVTLAALY